MKFFCACLAVFLCLHAPARAQDAPHNALPFSQWLSQLRHDAKTQGISERTLDDALGDIAPIERVITLDRKQPESSITLEEYLEKTVTKTRIAQGREQLADYRDTLAEAAKKYDVPAPIIVALWGMETSYGNNTGGFNVVAALATLAYDGRRSEFFRGELLNALWILDAEQIPAADLQGSWAGAMGQCQFMPSSFMRYAVDADGDGHRDIWNTQADVFASIANYLHSEGWDKTGDISEGSRNYKVLLKWNRSRYFVTAVGQLAQAIGE